MLLHLITTWALQSTVAKLHRHVLASILLFAKVMTFGIMKQNFKNRWITLNATRSVVLFIPVSMFFTHI